MRDSTVEPEPTEALSPSEIELLRLRAERYGARPLLDVRAAREAVVFQRADARYAVVLDELRELRPLRRFTRIPGATPLVPGVFHHRGEILSVYDLVSLFEARTVHENPSWVVVAERGRERLGFAADELIGIDSFHPESLKPLPITLGERVGCFAGVMPSGALVLDTPTFFQL